MVRNNNGKYNKIESSAPPLGVIKQKDKSFYKINKIKLNGSRFYAFTDGLSESINNDGEEIGIDGSINIIDVVLIVNYVLNPESLDYELILVSDLNNDQSIDIGNIYVKNTQEIIRVKKDNKINKNKDIQR